MTHYDNEVIKGMMLNPQWGYNGYIIILDIFICNADRMWGRTKAIIVKRWVIQDWIMQLRKLYNIILI